MVAVFNPQIIPTIPNKIVVQCGSAGDGNGEWSSRLLKTKIPLVLCVFSVSRVQAYSIPCTSAQGGQAGN